MGYQTELQPFSFETLSREDSFFTLDPAPPGLAGDGGTPINLLSRTGAGEASGILTPVGLAMSGDIPAEGLEGQIALIERGAISFRQKVDRAAEAGALAAVIYNSEPGNFRGTLGRRSSGSSSIPVVSISGEDGTILLEALSQGEITATVSVVRKELFSRNVVAEKPGPGDAIVVLGGHYDSVPNVAGANDNASGTAVLLSIARSLADRELPFTVRFVPFGSEELGLLGSQAYLDSLSDEEIALSAQC